MSRETTEAICTCEDWERQFWTIPMSVKRAGGNSKFLSPNECENTTYQNPWDATKAVIKENFATIDAYIKISKRAALP